MRLTDKCFRVLQIFFLTKLKWAGRGQKEWSIYIHVFGIHFKRFKNKIPARHWIPWIMIFWETQSNLSEVKDFSKVAKMEKYRIILNVVVRCRKAPSSGHYYWSFTQLVCKFYRLLQITSECRRYRALR